MVESLVLLGCLFGPFLAAWWMWRRMKRVNAEMAARNRAAMRISPSQEDEDGRGFDVNDELVQQGARASRNDWHLT